MLGRSAVPTRCTVPAVTVAVAVACEASVPCGSDSAGLPAQHRQGRTTGPRCSRERGLRRTRRQRPESADPGFAAALPDLSWSGFSPKRVDARGRRNFPRSTLELWTYAATPRTRLRPATPSHGRLSREDAFWRDCGDGEAWIAFLDRAHLLPVGQAHPKDRLPPLAPRVGSHEVFEIMQCDAVTAAPVPEGRPFRGLSFRHRSSPERPPLPVVGRVAPTVPLREVSPGVGGVAVNSSAPMRSTARG
jgi:hypothetical protein